MFHLEFSATLGFGLLKTDCCNKCTVFITTKKNAHKQLDHNLFLQTEALHDVHLKITYDRKDQMETVYTFSYTIELKRSNDWYFPDFEFLKNSKQCKTLVFDKN